ncbi:DNA polymerase III subunit alpha [Micrococcales bacterium 31B]|nr:DNA polymerase III subunit alpha [Micrococcales bacterium 31B]
MSTTSPFTHLHVASAFSAHFGSTWPENLAAAQASWGAEVASLTDRDGLYGSVRHVAACLRLGIKPVVGVEMLVRSPGLGSSPAHLGSVTVLAHGHNRGSGWASLCRVVSALHAPPPRSASGPNPHSGSRSEPQRGSEAARPVIDQSRLPAFLLGAEGQPYATVLLGPGSDVGEALLLGKHEYAVRLLKRWRSLLPHAIALEVSCLFTRPHSAHSLQHAAALLELAVSSETEAVLTNSVRLLEPGDAATADLVYSAGRLLSLDELRPHLAGPLASGQAWLKPPGKMETVARRIVNHAGVPAHTAVDLITTTADIAARCALDPEADLQWQQAKVPELAALGIGGGRRGTQSPYEILSGRTYGAITNKYFRADPQQIQRVRERLGKELDVIRNFSFETYFLTVADVSELISKMGVRHQARGSAVGSLVVYLLGISHVDPLEHDLLFERFLGIARETLPDIDIDVESARRHDIYNAIFKRYGSERVTLLSMQNRYRARGAIRDAGLALGMGEDLIDMIAKNVHRLNASNVTSMLRERPELRAILDLMEDNPKIQMLLDSAHKIDRLPRHLSMHPCGVILGNQDLLSTTPVQPSGLKIPMSQFGKDDINDMGLLKLDILGVRMQSSISYSLDQIARVHGPAAGLSAGLPRDAHYLKPDGHIDLSAVPLDDKATYETICTTHTIGMFQIESPGQRELVGKLQPVEFDDLIADISLFRPGPMKGDMIKPFINLRLGVGSPDYLHPSFAGFLRDSGSVVIYHEHIMRILHTCMGVSLSEADALRRIMGSHLEEVERRFRTETAANLDEHGRRRFNDADIERIWQVVAGFGSFGFCKAHAAAFAHTTYETAWLKTHYPAEFLCGLLQHDPGMYPRRLLVAEARRLQVPVLPVDINLSRTDYYVERLVETPLGEPTRAGDLGIRSAFKDVRGITEATLKRIAAEQPFTGVRDFYTRVSPPRDMMHRLGALGAFDSLFGPEVERGSVMAVVRNLISVPKPTSRPPLTQESSLFEFDEPIPIAPPVSAEERTAHELEYLGTELNQHLIETYRPMLTDMGVTPAEALNTLRPHTEVVVAGVRVATQTPPMKSGKRVVFISLDDGTGCSDATFFNEAQEASGPYLFNTRLMAIKGTIRRTGAKGVSIQASEAWDLKELWRTWQEARSAAAHLEEDHYASA